MRASKKIGRLLLPLLCFVLLLGPLTAGAQAASDVTARLRPDITIVIDGSRQIFYNTSGQQVHPLSFRDTTYLPLRAIGELMGKNVDWNQSTKTATLSGVRTAAATAGTPDANARARDVAAQLRDDFNVVVDDTVRTFTDANGKTVYPLLYQGSTYLPIRAIGELMGKAVSWDGKTNTITLSGTEVTDADTFSGGTAPSSGAADASGAISSIEDAKTRALALAGVTAEQATFTEAKLDRDDGRQVYEIEFYTGSRQTGTTKYEYKLDAATGEVLEYENKSGTSEVPGTGTASIISSDKAQEIALAKVPGAAAANIRELKLDRDDGKQVYEVEIRYNNTEYEIDIDAVTGNILKFESEAKKGK